MTQREAPQSSIHHLEGEFDLPSARMLEHTVRSTRAGDRVEIDFSRVRRFNDFGIAALARTLVKLDGRTVKLRGLSMHHVRLLRYFGVDADVFRAAPGPDREPG